MADNKNIEISDEMMAQINGGTASVSEQPFAFAVGDRVIVKVLDNFVSVEFCALSTIVLRFALNCPPLGEQL